MRAISFVKWFRVGCALALIASAPVHGDSGRPRLSVEWHQGRLRVDVDLVPIGELLTTIASRTGVEVRGLANIEGIASIRFEDRSLREGLSALLTQFNYAMFDEPTDRGGAEHIVVIVVGHKSVSDSETPTLSRRIMALETSGSGTMYGPDAYQVVHRLAEQGDVAALLDAVSFDDPTTRALAMQHLARLDPDAARRVATDAAMSEDPTQRVLALQVLGGLNSLEAAEALGVALRDPEAAVRQAAVVGLMGQRSPAAAHFLGRALQDGAEPVRLLAAELLTGRMVAGNSADNQ